jgi:hypothetical protein
LRLRGHGLAVHLAASEPGWQAVAVSLDQPVRGKGRPEGDQRLAEFLDDVENLPPQHVFLEAADEPFGAAVPLRCSDDGRRGRDAEAVPLLPLGGPAAEALQARRKDVGSSSRR